MKYLLDTCCISELMKRDPNPAVMKWFSDHDEADMYLSVVTFGELKKGIEKLPASKRRDELDLRVNKDLKELFRGRIIDVSLSEVMKWGEVLASCALRGTPIPAVDALIASTALANGLVVVTRNVKDMEPSGVDIVNPWG